MCRFVLFTCLWILALAAHGSDDPAYAISGLHVRLSFAEAVAATEALGGTCELQSLRRGALLFAGCTFASCAEPAGVGRCAQQKGGGPTLGTGRQPIVRVGLEAAGASRPLSKISIVFDGDAEEVAADLKRRFGTPFSDTTGQNEQSWSNSRRLHWKSGAEAMGLLKTINTITLFAEPVAGPEGSGPAGEVSGD